MKQSIRPFVDFRRHFYFKIMNKEIEIWKNVIGYEGYYEISNLGNVRSLDRIIVDKIRTRFLKGCNLKSSIKQSGYEQLVLSMNGKSKSFNVHQLMAINFLKHFPCKHKLVINHKNFIRNDNRLVNLEIVTQRENTNQKHLKSKSKYVGVAKNKRGKEWRASIEINRKRIYLGSFDLEEDASIAYQEELIKL